MVTQIINFFFITTSIILFILPFFISYWVGHRKSFKKIGFNHYLENFFSSKQANWLVFIWAAGEALIWFVIPEFLLLMVIFMRVHKKRVMLLFDLAGTVAGTIVAYIIRMPQDAIANLPYIQEKMVDQTIVWYNDMGILGLVNQPFSGVPYKVFTHLAWQYEYSVVLFIIVAVTVRMIRYVVAYGLFIAMYPRLHKIVYRNYVPLALAAIAIFSILLLKAYNAYS